MPKGPRWNMDKVNDDILDHVRKSERSLTPKRRRFIKEFLVSPESPATAAIRAGYSPRSARVIAHRLLQDDYIQSELAKHFVDQEEVVSQSLSQTLTRLKHIIEEGGTRDFVQAAKLLLAYTKLAVPVLGLEIKRVKPDVDKHADMSLEELIAEHEREAERLRELRAAEALRESQRVQSAGTEGPEDKAGSPEVH